MLIEGKSGRGATIADGHALHFYRDEAQLIGRVADFLTPAFEGDEGVLVLATDRHRLDLRSELLSRGIDLVRAERAGRSLGLDAAATLRSLLRDGKPDPGLFERIIGGAIDSVGSGRARVYCEVVSLLWLRGEPNYALALEHSWNDLHARRAFTLLCGYPARVFREPTRAELLSAVASVHSHVAPAEGYGLRPRA